MCMSNLFFKGYRGTEPPWHSKRVGDPRHPEYTVHDLTGREIARLRTDRVGRDYTPDQFRANLALIEHAPQLLAALTEYAYNADTAGIGVTPELANLILAAGGPDITSRTQPVDKTE